MKQILFLLFLSTQILSQRIFITGEKCKADFDVIFTRNLWQADFCIRYVSHEYQAGRSATRRGCDNWFSVSNEWQADYKVRVVNSVQPGRVTYYVYHENNDKYEPPLRSDPRNRYRCNNEYWYDDTPGDYKDRPKTRIIINPTIIFKTH